MRVFFLSEDELIGSMGPAPGSYNPHEIYGIEKKYQRDDFGEKFPFKQYMKNFKDSEKTKREKTKEEIQRQSQKMERNLLLQLVSIRRKLYFYCTTKQFSL